MAFAASYANPFPQYFLFKIQPKFARAIFKINAHSPNMLAFIKNYEFIIFGFFFFPLRIHARQKMHRLFARFFWQAAHVFRVFIIYRIFFCRLKMLSSQRFQNQAFRDNFYAIHNIPPTFKNANIMTRKYDIHLSSFFSISARQNSLFKHDIYLS